MTTLTKIYKDKLQLKQFTSKARQTVLKAQLAFICFNLLQWFVLKHRLLFALMFFFLEKEPFFPYWNFSAVSWIIYMSLIDCKWCWTVLTALRLNGPQLDNLGPQVGTQRWLRGVRLCVCVLGVDKEGSLQRSPWILHEGGRDQTVQWPSPPSW